MSIAEIWSFLKKRWKEQADVTNTDTHGVTKWDMLQLIMVYYSERGKALSIYGILFNSDVTKLTNSPVSHMRSASHRMMELYWIGTNGLPGCRRVAYTITS